MAEENSYERDRQKRLQENNKRMQELGLSKLSGELAQAARPASKPQAPKKIKEVLGLSIERRTSSRVKRNPTPIYQEVDYGLSNYRPRKKISSRGRAILPLEYSASPKAREMAYEHSEIVAKDLEPQFPFFIKSLVRSHVSSCFWLGLPQSFCRKHLPKKDTMMLLEDDEKDIKWDVMFLADRTGISGGWRGYSLKRGLDDGDAVIFQLVESTKFKVHITKAKDFESNGKTKKENNAGKKEKQTKSTGTKVLKS